MHLERNIRNKENVLPPGVINNLRISNQHVTCFLIPSTLKILNEDVNLRRVGFCKGVRKQRTDDIKLL